MTESLTPLPVTGGLSLLLPRRLSLGSSDSKELSLSRLRRWSQAILDTHSFPFPFFDLQQQKNNNDVFLKGFCCCCRHWGRIEPRKYGTMGACLPFVSCPEQRPYLFMQAVSGKKVQIGWSKDPNLGSRSFRLIWIWIFSKKIWIKIWMHLVVKECGAFFGLLSSLFQPGSERWILIISLDRFRPPHAVIAHEKNKYRHGGSTTHSLALVLLPRFKRFGLPASEWMFLFRQFHLQVSFLRCVLFVLKLQPSEICSAERGKIPTKSTDRAHSVFSCPDGF